MTKRRRESFADLMEPVIQERRFLAFCREAGLNHFTVRRLIEGARPKVHRRTVRSLARGLGVSEERVRKSLET